MHIFEFVYECIIMQTIFYDVKALVARSIDIR